MLRKLDELEGFLRKVSEAGSGSIHVEANVLAVEVHMLLSGIYTPQQK